MSRYFEDSSEADAIVREEELLQLNLVTQEVHYVMRSELGKRFLKRLMVLIAKTDEISFCGEPHHTAFNEGARSVGIWLKKAIETADEGYLPQVMKQRFVDGSVHSKKK